MSQRRMFSPQIIDSDAFMELPISSQNLYFHMGMRADDDGFVGNPKKIMKMVGGRDVDLQILIAKRFLISFETGVVVIKHWRIHNLIRADRYHETTYLEEKGKLIIKENGSYTEGITIRQPNGNQWLPEVRLGKEILPDFAKAQSGLSEEETKPERITDSKPEVRMSALGFPLPEGWTEDNRGFESEDSEMPNLIIKDAFGMKVPQRELTRRIRAFTAVSRPKEIEVKDARIPRIFQKFKEMCKKELGKEPVDYPQSVTVIKAALNRGGLTEEKIYDLLEEWFSLGKRDEDTIQIRQALSSYQINAYNGRLRV